ncbi:unnamed protein product [Oppiella nova]|uniref:Bromo domain-containing protein n=1 Tax=Oppiella nova TaxID=334625 RepID=A0A7R9QTT6_9ACAR|nr:unnamed protein product [Oppiella nova]CAG2175400.1 unnamed protein product [Oppiella nova]
MLDFRNAINDAMKRSVIKKVMSDTDSVESYQPFNWSHKRRRNDSKNSSHSQNSSHRIKAHNNGHKKAKTCETSTGDQKQSSKGNRQSSKGNKHSTTESDIESQSTTSSDSTTKKSMDREAVKLSQIDYKDWLLETLPRYSPFIGQVGDRVVYMRDAHHIYIKYELRQLREQYPRFKCEYDQITDQLHTDDYIINAKISDVKFYQTNYIQFSVVWMESLSKETPFKFCVLYRPNRDANDFLVLDKFYGNPRNAQWRPGMRFKSICRNSWWMGTVDKRSVFNHKYPDSLFKCYEVVFNSGERQRLSPWEVFDVGDGHQSMVTKTNGIRVTLEDLLDVNYKPGFTEWPEVEGYEFELWRCCESKRIYSGIKYVEDNVRHELVAIFKTCDCKEIAYPITVTHIKQRLKNMWYRRKSTIILDISYLRINAKLTVRSHDYPSASAFVDLLLSIVNDIDAIHEPQYADHVDKYQHLFRAVGLAKPETALHVFADHSYYTAPIMPGPSGVSKSPAKPKSSAKHSSHKSADPSGASKVKFLMVFVFFVSNRSRKYADEATVKPIETTESTQWVTDSLRFIDDLCTKDDSQPFRLPVDPVQYPLYRTVISEPIDLSEIRRKLNDKEYPNPKEVREDFRLMFTNAKLFNKNPKAPIRKINKRLSTLCEDKLREVIVDWERVLAYERKQRKQTGFRVREPKARQELWGFGAQQFVSDCKYAHYLGVQVEWSGGGGQFHVCLSTRLRDIILDFSSTVVSVHRLLVNITFKS